MSSLWQHAPARGRQTMFEALPRLRRPRSFRGAGRRGPHRKPGAPEWPTSARPRRLHHALAQAAALAGTGTEVLEAVNVAMPGNKLLVPDVVVVAAEATNDDDHQDPQRCRAGGRGSRIPIDDVQIDRAIRAGHVRGSSHRGLLAGRAAGHAAHRRLHPEPGSLRHPHDAHRRDHRPQITKPFPVEIDPAHLTRRIG